MIVIVLFQQDEEIPVMVLSSIQLGEVCAIVNELRQSFLRKRRLL